jgi:hypothetical protein
MQYNILYQGRAIYKNLSEEQCTEVLDELSQYYYNHGDYDPSEIELEQIGVD